MQLNELAQQKLGAVQFASLMLAQHIHDHMAEEPMVGDGGVGVNAMPILKRWVQEHPDQVVFMAIATMEFCAALRGIDITRPLP